MTKSTKEKRACSKAYYQANKEKILKRMRTYNKVYREENREKISRQRKGWRDEHPDIVTQRIKQRSAIRKQKRLVYNEEHKDEIAVAKAARKLAARERGNMLRRKHYHNNKELYSTRMKDYYQANKEKIKAQQAEYHRKNALKTKKRLVAYSKLL